ncbi:MAG: SHOCT domain-containing protein [Thermodesulfovibrionales bacterium]
MKRVMFLAVIVMMLFSAVAEAGWGSSFWGAYAGSSLANSMAQPPAPTVVVVQPQQSNPPQYPTTQPIPSIIGKIVAANWDSIILKDQAGQTYSLRFYSASKNLTGKTITVSDELLAVSTTGASGDMIDTISFAPLQQQQPNSSDNGDVESRLKKAKSLKEQGLITEEEYTAARKKILQDL